MLLVLGGKFLDDLPPTQDAIVAYKGLGWDSRSPKKCRPSSSLVMVASWERGGRSNPCMICETSKEQELPPNSREILFIAMKSRSFL